MGLSLLVLYGLFLRECILFVDAHLVEAAIYKYECDQQEYDSDVRSDGLELGADSNLHSKHTEEGGELDDWVEGY